MELSKAMQGPCKAHVQTSTCSTASLISLHWIFPARQWRQCRQAGGSEELQQHLSNSTTLAPWHQMAPASLSRKSIQIHPNPKVAALNSDSGAVRHLIFPLQKTPYWPSITFSRPIYNQLVRNPLCQGGDRKSIDSVASPDQRPFLTFLTDCSTCQLQVYPSSSDPMTQQVAIHCTSTRQHAGMQKIWISCPAISCERIGSGLGLMVAIHQ